MIAGETAGPPMIITLAVLTPTIRYIVMVTMFNLMAVVRMFTMLELHLNITEEAFHHRMEEAFHLNLVGVNTVGFGGRR